MDFIVTIPANKEYPILNATHATAIILYELFKHSKEGHVNLALPKKEQIDVLLDYVKKIIDKLPQPDYRKEYYFIIMRKLITQGIINSREANTLIGFFRSIYENLK